MVDVFKTPFITDEEEEEEGFERFGEGRFPGLEKAKDLAIPSDISNIDPTDEDVAQLLYSGGRSDPSSEDVDAFMAKGRNSVSVMNDLTATFGKPGAAPPTGFAGGFGRGAAFNLLGEEPRGVSGHIGLAAGIITNIVAQTLLFKRAFGLSGATTRLGQIGGEVLSGLAADVTYMAVDPYEEDALIYGLMIGANIGLPVLSGLAFSSKMIPGILDDVTDAVTKESIDGTDIAARANIKIEPDSIITAESKIKHRPGFDHADVAKRSIKPKTQSEVDILHTNQATDRTRIRYEELHAEYIRENDRILNVADTKVWKGSTSAIRNKVQTFLKGKTLTDEQQLILLNKFDSVDDPGLWKTYNDEFLAGKWRTGSETTQTRREFTRSANQLVREVDVINENRMLGLTKTATKKERTKVLKALKMASTKHIKRLSSDKVLKSNRGQIVASLKSLTGKPEDLAVSQGFAKSAEFNQKFIQSLAYMSKLEDPVLRKEAAFSVFDEIQKHSDKINKTIRLSLAAAFKSTRQEVAQTEALERLLVSGQKINVDEFDTIRPQLSKYIVRQLEDAIITPMDNARLSATLREFDAKLTKAKGNVTEQRALVAERQAIKKKAIQDLVSNPVAVMKAVDTIGDKKLGDAVDLFYASAGDKTAAARLLVRRNQSMVDTQARVSANQLGRNRRPNAGPGEPPTSATDEFGTGRPNEVFETHISDLNPVRRLLGSLDAAVDRSLKETSNPFGKKLFTDIRGWLDKVFTARNTFLTEVKEFGELKLQPFYEYTRSLGKEGGEEVYSLIDNVARKADDMLDEGFTPSQVESKVLEMTGSQSGLSGPLRKGYEMFRDITDDLHLNVNQAIRQHNELVSQGLRRGEVVEELTRRPGYVPYFYDGAYILKVAKDDNTFTLFVNNRKEAVEKIRDLYKGATLQGRITLEPRFMDDLEEAVAFTQPGHSIDDVFGIDAGSLNTLLSKGGLNDNNLHRVFWGNKLQRTLSAADQRLGVERAIELGSRLSFKFKHYFPIAQEGTEIVKRAKALDLHNYASAIKTYADDILGRSRGTEKEVEKWVQSVMTAMTDHVPGSRALLEAMGVSQHSRVVRSVANALTFVGRMAALGFNPASAVVQWFILPTNVAPVIGFKNVVTGLRTLGKVKNTEGFKQLMQKAGLHVNPANIGMADRIIPPKALMSTAGRARMFVDYLGMAMFNGSENNIRAATLLGARKFGKDIGKSMQGRAAKTWQEEMLVDVAASMGKRVDDSDVLDAFAIKTMKRTNFDFDETGLSELARNPLFKPFAQFKTYFFKEIEFLFFGGLPLTHRERFISLGMFTAIGGMFGLPLIEEVDQYATAAFGVSPKLWAHEHLPEALIAGLPTLVGMDVSSKANVGSLSRAFAPSGLVGVAPGKLWQQYRSYSEGNQSALGAMAGTSSAIKAFGDALEYTTTGRLTDKFGQPLAAEGDLNAFQTFGLGMGFSPKSVSFAMQASHISHILDRKASARDRSALRDYFDAIQDGDTAEANKIAQEAELTGAQIKAARKKRYTSVYDSINSRSSKENRSQMESLNRKLRR